MIQKKLIKQCPKCKGKGFVTGMAFGERVTITCPTCKGLGVVYG